MASVDVSHSPDHARPASARRRRKEARPVELLDAALDLFVEKGYAATRTEEVASRAGVSKGTLYLYFPSKEELLKAVVRHHLSHHIVEGAGFIQRFPGPSDELMASLLRDWWQRIVNTPASGILKLMMSEVRNFPDLAQFYLEEVIEPSHRLLAAMVERGIARGEFQPLPVADVVHALIAPMLFMAMHKHSFGACPGHSTGFDMQSFIDTQIELLLNGLRREPRGQARARGRRSAPRR